MRIHLKVIFFVVTSIGLNPSAWALTGMATYTEFGKFGAKSSELIMAWVAQPQAGENTQERTKQNSAKQISYQWYSSEDGINTATPVGTLQSLVGFSEISGVGVALLNSRNQVPKENVEGVKQRAFYVGWINEVGALTLSFQDQSKNADNLIYEVQLPIAKDRVVVGLGIDSFDIDRNLEEDLFIGWIEKGPKTYAIHYLVAFDVNEKGAPTRVGPKYTVAKAKPLAEFENVEGLGLVVANHNHVSKPELVLTWASVLNAGQGSEQSPPQSASIESKLQVGLDLEENGTTRYWYAPGKLDAPVRKDSPQGVAKIAKAGQAVSFVSADGIPLRDLITFGAEGISIYKNPLLTPPYNPSEEDLKNIDEQSEMSVAAIASQTAAGIFSPGLLSQYIDRHIAQAGAVSNINTAIETGLAKLVPPLSDSVKAELVEYLSAELAPNKASEDGN